jgi:hypothetical protein
LPWPRAFLGGNGFGGWDAVLLVRLLSRGKLIGRSKLTGGEVDLSKQVLTAVAAVAAVAVEK